MIRIGLTGPSGSGKGYISSLLAKRGVPTLDCDRVVHTLYQDESFVQVLSMAFGVDLSAPDGSVNRKRLGEIVYNDPEAMKKLANLVYPPVRQRYLGYLEKAEEVGYSAAAVDAPQLFEAGFEKDYDCILCVTAPEEERLRRIVLRDGISAEQAKLRMKNQKTEEEYRMRSDFVLNNGADDRPEETLAQILGKMGIR